MFLALAIALLLFLPTLGVAQPLRSFEDLALRVNIGDQLRIEDRSGAKATGRLTRLTREAITIQTDTGEKRVARDAVRTVALGGRALQRGALIGAGVFAVLGTVATCVRERGDTCFVIGSLGAAPIGSGVGLALGALIPRMRTVYVAPENVPSASDRPDATGAPASLLENLALHVNLDDQLQVDDRAGLTTTGRLTRLTADQFTIRTANGEKHFTRETVRQVARRHRPIRQGVLIGAGVGVAAGAVAACTGPSREECVDGPIMAGALGAGLGLAVAALIHRTTTVYPEPPAKAASVSAQLPPGGVGIRVNLRW